MYTYKIGYHSHEDSNYVELKHVKKFTDVQLFDLVVEAIAALFPHIVHQDDSNEKYRWADANHTAVIRESDQKRVELSNKDFISWKRSNRYYKKHSAWIRRHTAKPIEIKKIYYEHSLYFEEFFNGGYVDETDKNNIVYWLIVNKGFSKIKYEKTLSIFGWDSVISGNKRDESFGSPDFDMQKKLAAYGITKEKYPTQEQLRRENQSETEVE